MKTLKKPSLRGPTLRASCRPSKTAFLKGSVSFFKSAFARLRADIRSSKMVGNNPFLLLLVTKKSIEKKYSDKQKGLVVFKTRHYWVTECSPLLGRALGGLLLLCPEASCNKDYEPS